MTNPIEVLSKGLVIVAIGYCACRIWRGRKVKDITWEEDDNNPANWYLKDPNKFRKE